MSSSTPYSQVFEWLDEFLESGFIKNFALISHIDEVLLEIMPKSKSRYQNWRLGLERLEKCLYLNLSNWKNNFQKKKKIVFVSFKFF